MFYSNKTPRFIAKYLETDSRNKKQYSPDANCISEKNDREKFSEPSKKS